MVPGLESSPVGATNRMLLFDEGITVRFAALLVSVPNSLCTVTVNTEPVSADDTAGVI